MKQVFAGIFVILYACTVNNRDDRTKSHPSHHYNYVKTDSTVLRYAETNYVPVYSDIYQRDGTRRFYLTTTLSIRNTSLQDSTYVLSAKYYDSHGNMLKEYADSTILLTPLESVEFVVEENEKTGGAGANFIVKWGARSNSSQMLIQSVMIGTSGQQGISFITDAKKIGGSEK